MKLKFTIGFLNILVAGVIVGALILVRLTFNPYGLDFPHYLTQQKLLLKGLGELFIPVAPAILILTLLSAYLEKEKSVRIILLVATFCILLNIIVSAFGNVPINNQVMMWNEHTVPDNWQDLRDSWWLLNNIRLLSAMTALCLIILANTSDKLQKSNGLEHS